MHAELSTTHSHPTCRCLLESFISTQKQGVQRSLAKRLRIFMRQASDDEQLQMHTLQVTCQRCLVSFSLPLPPHGSLHFSPNTSPAVLVGWAQRCSFQ